MRRLLEDCGPAGDVFVHYEPQWRTFFKALRGLDTSQRRLRYGNITRITEVGIIVPEIGCKLTPHAFKPTKAHKQCSICGGWADASYHNLELFTDADREREKARQIQEAADLTPAGNAPIAC